ncbi:MAG: hypothetical protein U1F49_18375 [Rubrivivax sp.]
MSMRSLTMCGISLTSEVHAHQQRVAVVRRLDQIAHRDGTDGTGLGLDDCGLPQFLRQRLGHQARDEVGRCTGRAGRNHAQRLAREGLGARRGQAQRRGGRGQQAAPHGVVSRRHRSVLVFIAVARCRCQAAASRGAAAASKRVRPALALSAS